MTWQDFYLICFLVGFALSFVSFALGSFHFNLHFHGHVDVSHLGHFHAHAGGGHANAGSHPSGHAPAPSHGLSTHEPEISWFNFGTMTAFLAWFGGTGYLLTRFSGWLAWMSFGLAIVAGLTGAAIMFWFVAKVLLKHDKALDPIDYEMIGVLATVTSPIRQGGTGEVVFLQEGSRCCAGARADQGEAIPKGTEVIVTRYEKGLAYVRLWEEMANGASTGQAKSEL